jgi:hypothetical protein
MQTTKGVKEVLQARYGGTFDNNVQSKYFFYVPSSLCPSTIRQSPQHKERKERRGESMKD